MFKLIEIEINHHCNLSCSYCPNSKFERIEKGEMATELFIRLMSQLRDIEYNGLVMFHFYGEPLLCSKLDEFIKIMKEYIPDARLQIYSNGLFLNFKRIMELFHLGVDYFVVTKHEEIKENFIFEKTLDKLEQKYKERIIYNKYTEIELNNRGGLLPHLEKKGEKDFTGFPCMIAQLYTVITLKGNVLPCYEDFNQTEVMGNIGENSIKEIWNSPRYVEFRSFLKKKRGLSNSNLCKNCDNFTVISKDW